VIRCGLHPSEGLLSGKEYCAGPFHPAFRQKVETYLSLKFFRSLLKNKGFAKKIKGIYYSPKETTFVIGHRRAAAVFVENLIGRHGIFKPSLSVRPGTLRFEFSDGKRKIIDRAKY
jgi:hypothetical protein